jgi:hypothetical protein
LYCTRCLPIYVTIIYIRIRIPYSPPLFSFILPFFCYYVYVAIIYVRIRISVCSTTTICIISFFYYYSSPLALYPPLSGVLLLLLLYRYYLASGCILSLRRVVIIVVVSLFSVIIADLVQKGKACTNSYVDSHWSRLAIVGDGGGGDASSIRCCWIYRLNRWLTWVFCTRV